MAAAAAHLTPTILELGGKNPAIVTRDANISVAAKKIVDGRFKNAGQFCVAPDYVLCDENVLDEFLKCVQRAVTTFFGKNPQDSESFGRIVSERHCKRLAALISDPTRGGKVLMGGDVNISQRYVSPTVILNPSVKSKVMTQEIFGPVLPVLSVKSADDAMEFVNDRHSPLALYVFSRSSSTCNHVVNGTRSGGVCVNDVIVHMLNETLPFGGFGESGMGNYHGIYGFRAFSHERAVMIVDPSHDDLSRYPPYKSAL
jgi:aldehyde dehydrogenase (NAD+)